MKFNAALAAAAVLASGSVAAPAASPSELSARQDSMKVPHFTQLYAQVNGNGTNIGCINRQGRFIRNLTYCAFITTRYVSQNNGVDGILSTYAGDCTISTGPLDGATFTCADTTSTNYGYFWNRDGFLSIDGPTGTAYSINSFPDEEDTVGVPLIIGGSGAWGQFKLQDRSVQG